MLFLRNWHVKLMIVAFAMGWTDGNRHVQLLYNEIQWKIAGSARIVGPLSAMPTGYVLTASFNSPLPVESKPRRAVQMDRRNVLSGRFVTMIILLINFGLTSRPPSTA